MMAMLKRGEVVPFLGAGGQRVETATGTRGDTIHEATPAQRQRARPLIWRRGAAVVKAQFQPGAGRPRHLGSSAPRSPSTGCSTRSSTQAPRPPGSTSLIARDAGNTPGEGLASARRGGHRPRRRPASSEPSPKGSSVACTSCPASPTTRRRGQLRHSPPDGEMVEVIDRSVGDLPDAPRTPTGQPEPATHQAARRH